MNRNYLKIRTQDCPKCQGRGTWEAVVSGIMNHKRKENKYSERIIGHHCFNCGYEKKAKL